MNLREYWRGWTTAWTDGEVDEGLFMMSPSYRKGYADGNKTLAWIENQTR